MNPTPTTRTHHALRWVLGVGLVFVVVVALALQVARRRADERWVSVLSHCEEEGMPLTPQRHPRFIRTGEYFLGTRGGNIFREWREGEWFLFRIGLRQERNFFGSSIEASISGVEPRLVKSMRDIFAGVDVEVVVEP